MGSGKMGENGVSSIFENGENGVSSIFGPITTLFNYFNESKIELTPFSLRERKKDPLWIKANCWKISDFSNRIIYFPQHTQALYHPLLWNTEYQQLSSNKGSPCSTKF